MLKSSPRLVHFILIAIVASLTLAPATQAAYDYKKTVTVDHTRVAGLNATPPSGFSFLKSVTIDHTQVAGSGAAPR